VADLTAQLLITWCPAKHAQHSTACSALTAMVALVKLQHVRACPVLCIAATSLGITASNRLSWFDMYLWLLLGKLALSMFRSCAWATD